MFTIQASTLPMLVDEIRLYNNGESYMDFTLEVSQVSSKETVATWTPGFPASHLVYSRGKEQEVQLVTPREKLRIVTVLQPPFMMHDEDSGYSGYCYDLLLAVAETLK